MPHLAPKVVKRFQNRVSRIAGRLAEAAMAKARATRNATLRSLAKIDRATATAPMTTAAIFAVTSSCRSVALPLRITLAYRSWANDEEEVRVSPATTARMVANATAAMKASIREPPVVPAPPPRCSASRVAAVLPDGSFSLIVAVPTSAAAPKPSTRVIR